MAIQPGWAVPAPSSFRFSMWEYGLGPLPCLGWQNQDGQRCLVGSQWIGPRVLPPVSRETRSSTWGQCPHGGRKASSLAAVQARAETPGGSGLEHE